MSKLLKNLKVKSYVCHSGLSGILFRKDSPQEGVTDNGADNRSLVIQESIRRLIAPAAFIAFLLTGIFHISHAAEGQAGVSITEIRVSFKLDTRLTQGLYMGDRWVSPPTFSGVAEGKEYTVEARAVGLDVRGSIINISPEWKAGDPSMVAISPGKGANVKLTVLKEGESEVAVVSGDITRKLTVKARRSDKVMYVDISR